MKTHTPRTDEQCFGHEFAPIDGEFVDSFFARKLEEELNTMKEAQKDLVWLAKCVAGMAARHSPQMREHALKVLQKHGLIP